VRQVVHIAGILLGEVLHGPHRRLACDRVEPFEIILARAGAVVIAADHDEAVLAHPFGHRVRVRAVTYQVATAYGLVVLAFGGCKYRGERLQISVKIADDQIEHESWGLGLSETQQRDFGRRADARRHTDRSDSARDISGRGSRSV